MILFLRQGVDEIQRKNSVAE